MYEILELITSNQKDVRAGLCTLYQYWNNDSYQVLMLTAQITPFDL